MSRKLLVLSVLYFVQGLPYGFQATALPVYMRQEGVSLKGIGLASALSLPWIFKVIWGPWVDRFGSPSFGRRRSWIVPLQVALAAACGVAALIEPQGGLIPLLSLALLMNVFASTLDVAVDGLAVDVLEPRELGYGNIAQVVGYKVGMLTGGGLLVWASQDIGWDGLFLSMAGLILLALAVTATFREPAQPAGVRSSQSVTAVLRALGQAMKVPGAAWVIAFIATYKLGESMADAMFRPFLVDGGITRGDIGLWLGTYGLLFSLVGSFLGGIAASRFGLLRTVAAAAALRALAVGGEWWLSLVELTPGRVISVIAVEHAFGGALTTAIFAVMMSRVDRQIGATHYTVFATIEVAGKLFAGWLSGYFATWFGYAGVFAIATVLAFAFLGLLYPIFRLQAGEVESPRIHA
ncbi:MAG: MFS transporter [Acidobacteriota bacterium]